MNPFKSRATATPAADDSPAAEDQGSLAKLRERIGDRLVPVVETPWSWTDNGGLYWGEGGAWLYRTLPSWVMDASSAGLEELLTDLATTCGDRQVHLLAYSWEENVSAPDRFTGSHAEYVTGSLRAVLPTTMFLVGVRLEEDPVVERRRSRFTAVVTETLDSLMAEWVPNLATYDRDRALVSGVLDRYGCTVAAGTRLNMLEFWYTLGINRDSVFVERDQSVAAGRDLIECVSIRSFSEAEELAEVSNPLDAGPASTMVASVRGRLHVSKGRGTARLTGTSLVVGRRSGSSARTLGNTLNQQLRGVEAKPLPMRQVVALDETLPCSQESVDPHLFGVDVAKLRRVGFNDASNGGDQVGLLLGMVSPGYAHPRFVDVFSTPGHTVAISGTGGAGKTFLLEHLAGQCHLLGVPTVVLRDTGDAGTALLHGPVDPADRPVSVLDTPAPGILDPFVHLSPAAARRTFSQVLTAAAPDLAAEDLFALDGELARMAPASLTCTPAVIAQLRDQRLAALLGRFIRTPAGRLLASPAPFTPARGTQVWDLAALLAEVTDAGPRAALVELATAAALTATSGGGVLLADDTGTWRPGTPADLVRSELVAAGTAGALVATTSIPAHLVDGSIPTPDTTVMLQHDADVDVAPALASRGVEASEELVDWLAAAGATIENDMVGSTSLGLVWNRDDAPRGISIGPVPLSWVPVLTRGRASEYLADRVFS